MSCPFCNLPEERILYRGKHASALFSLWPVSDYHLLIIPNRHVTREKELKECEVLELHKLKVYLVELIERKTGLKDYNFGLNQGELAGQTVPHLHYHVIFRKFGDVEDPSGGIRNIIPNMGNYMKNPIPKREEDVKKWTEEIKRSLRL
ncbi:MAG: HIT domain-containing protein [Candidatus Aenigmatarchaeota archaeon]